MRVDKVVRDARLTVTHPLSSRRLLGWLLWWRGTEHVSEGIAELQKIVESVCLLWGDGGLIGGAEEVHNVSRRWWRCEERIRGV